MRAQVIPFVFLVLLVGGTILGYIFYNSFYGTSYEGSISERYTIDVLRNELERAKGYLKQSLIYSSHQSLREHACLSGQVGAMEWICNEPNTYSPDDSKGCLEKYTLYYENNYLNNYSILGLPITFTKKNFSSCVYGVDESGVFSGKYDEGDFWVNITGAALAVSGGSAAASEDVNLNTFITRNRFWYMWRIFHEWAEDDVYSPCICEKIGCACSSSSEEEACTSCKDESEECGERALKDLQRRFNKTEIVCHRTKPYACCAQGIGPISCVPKRICYPWDNSICISPCKHECVDPPPIGPLCPVPSTGFASTTQQYYDSNGLYKYLDNFNLNPFSIVLAYPIPCQICKCDYYVEARFASSHQYTCIDNKYHVPSDKGPVPLTFRASAIAFWRAPDLCHNTYPCSGSYDSETESCIDCDCPPCPENPCY